MVVSMMRSLELLLRSLTVKAVKGAVLEILANPYPPRALLIMGASKNSSHRRKPVSS